MGELELASTTVTTSLTIHLVFRPMGWATFVVDDAQGTLSIESDWGSYAYRWGRGEWLGVEPPDLSRALAGHIGSDHDYIARKLVSPVHETDVAATVRYVRKEILRMRRERALDAFDARWAWDCLVDVDTEDEFYSAMNELPLNRYFCEPWNLVLTRATGRFLVVRDHLLPAFVEQLRAHLRAADLGGAVAEEVRGG